MSVHSRWLVLSASLSLLACDPYGEPKPSQRVEVSGPVRFADGTPVAPQTMNLVVTLDGHDLFSASEGCEYADPQMPGQLSEQTSPTSGGTISFSFSVGDLAAITDPGCFVSARRLSEANELRVDASIPANTANCAAFCANRPSGERAACASGCSGADRRILAVGRVTSTLLKAIDAAAGADGTARATIDLVFEELSPVTVTTHGPDLQVDERSARTTAYVSEELFSAGSCAVVEGCFNGPTPSSGTFSRRLLRFDGVIQNLGDEDFVIGATSGNPLFEFSGCHGHYHMKEAMSYELLHADTLQPVTLNGQAVVGRKQGFCMLDMRRMSGTNPPRYTCGYQGLTAGWADVYSSGLDCQWVDVTGVPAGPYVLKVTVNPTGSLVETNKNNNSAYVPVSVPAS
jgi:hypothetical protein